MSNEASTFKIRDIDLKFITDVLCTQRHQRHASDYKHIGEILKQVSFFKKRNLKDVDFWEIISGLQHKQMTVGTAACRYGDFGNTFYIILKGECSVWLPRPPEVMLPLLKEWFLRGDFTFEYKDSQGCLMTPENFVKTYGLKDEQND